MRYFILILLLPVFAFADEHKHPSNFCQPMYKTYNTEKSSASTSDRYDVLDYKLSLDVDPDADFFNGSVRVRFNNPLGDNAIVLDVTAPVIVDNVTSAGDDLVFDQTADSLVVMLSNINRVGGEDSITVYYHAELLPSGNGLTVQDYHRRDPENILKHGTVIASMSEPQDARSWWPCKDVPSDKATATISITAPDSMTAVSNGALLSDTDNGDGTHTAVWRTENPIATYLVSIAVSRYVHFESMCIDDVEQQIELHNWVFPPDSTRAVTDFAPLCEMIGYMESFCGQYPFVDEKYGHAEFLSMITGAMEHQTVTSYGMFLLQGDNRFDTIVLHELAHQWFGNLVTPQEWADIWLNEGFATYCQALWEEHLNGHEAYINFMTDDLFVSDYWSNQCAVYDPHPIFPGRVIYDKGAWILHMLRCRIGDELFFELLGQWLSDNNRPYHNASTNDFIVLASNVANQNLLPFFRPYLEETVVPQIRWSYTVGADQRTLTLNVEEAGTVLFDNIYPIRVSMPTGQTFVYAHLTGFSGTYEYELPDQIVGVEFDPEKSVLWSPAGFESLNTAITNVWPNPSFNGVVSFMYRLNVDSQVVYKFYDARGRLLQEVDLGEVAVSATEIEYLWDGRDSQGRPLTSGIYWAVMEVENERSVRKFSIVR